MAITIAACVAIIVYWEHIEHLRNYGYIGAFLAGFIAGSSLPLPLPYIVVNFTLGSVLNPALVGVSSGLGAGIGGTLVYLLGRGGGTLLGKLGIKLPDPNNPEQTKSRYLSRFYRWAHRRGSVVVFIMSALLNPAFGPMAITMGALRFQWAKFLLWCTAGNIVKSMIIAYCGYLGLDVLLRWTGAK